nr:glycosyltransferase family A protein [Rhodohalobacter sp. 614A]
MVSIIIPVFNGEDFVADVFRNVEQQDYPSKEIIFVDDGSEDSSKEIIQQIDDVQYVYQPNRGPASARNTGFRKSRGKYIAFLDVDDLWTENQLAHQVNVLEENPQYDMVQGRIQDLKRIGENKNAGIFEKTGSPYYSVNLGSAVFRRTVFETVGLFDENLHFNEDTDWFVRAWDKKIQKKKVEEVVLHYRKHANNLTHHKNSRHSGMAWLLKKRLDLQRRENQSSENSVSSRWMSINEYIGW